MTERNPWEGHEPLRPEAGGVLSLFRGPNLPFTLLITVALAGLISFLFLVENPFAPQTAVAAPTTTVATTATTVAGGTDTTLPADTTETTTGTTVPAATSVGAPGDISAVQLRLQQVASGIPFPVFAASIQDDDRIFVLERQGRIRIIDSTGLIEAPYLDLTDRVGSGGIENGLLGMAFHPDFTSNGRLFVYYTDTDLDSRLSEFSTNASSNSVDRGTESILFEVDQEGIRHRAGMLQFGPDGYLWAALGDGGLGDDSSQDLTSLQGNLLRLDVDGGDPYGIPATNPLVGSDGRDEIWAHGLRNPWRFSIDFESRLVFIADVGQANWEEINVASIDNPGLDFGWPNFEGTDCYTPSDGCDMTGWEAPTLKYDHSQGCSVTGGYVYRGDAIPELQGHYLYADWCNGMIRSFTYQDGAPTQETNWTSMLSGAGQVASFGIDGSGEMLVVDSNGTIYRIVRA
jgi:glucose/arabinose dehydrogenase